jgi:CheY-like chemotaxis protein
MATIEREGGGPVILVVDDDMAAVRVIGELLSRQACRILVATSLLDAVSTATEIRTDYVLAATILPDGTGEELREWFEDDPLLRHIPIFLMVGWRPRLIEFGGSRLIGSLPFAGLLAGWLFGN